MKRKSKKRIVKIFIAFVAVALLGLVGLGFLLMRLFDYPEKEDPHHDEIAGLLDPAKTKYYRYSLGGYIDEEELWRIDGDRASLEELFSYLELTKTDSIPQEFWRIRPHYWPKSDFSASEAYRSPSFEASSRGSDGVHSMAVYDPTKKRAYIWVKINF